MCIATEFKLPYPHLRYRVPHYHNYNVSKRFYHCMSQCHNICFAFDCINHFQDMILEVSAALN